MKIESIHNSKVKEWVKLKEKKYRDSIGLFLIEGDHLMKEALDDGCVCEIISNNTNYQVANIPFYEVNDAILKKISSQISGTDVICVCKKREESDIQGSICILDSLQDPGNLGTIIRSAVAFSIDTLIISSDSVDLYNEKVIRASEGAIFHLNIIRADLKDILPKLKHNGYTIYGTDVKKGTTLNEIAFKEKKAVIIGNEGSGMHEDLKKTCDDFIYIPISGKMESLNAGVAASIIFYQLSL